MFGFIRLFLLLLFLQGCAGNLSVTQTTTQQYIINDQQAEASSINSLVKPYRDSLDAKVNRVLATSDAEMMQGSGRNLKPMQIAMGNFMVDACMDIAKQKAKELNKPSPDISIFTWGSVRGSLPAGDITLRNIYQLMPFENEMVVLKLSGSQTKALLNQLAMNFSPIAGATILKGELNQISINGSPLDETKFYYVLASDYLSFGGDNLSILEDVTDRYLCGIKVRDALVQYLENLKANGKTLTPNYEQRIKN
jgi:2',3'-cyclic-nucleotide 2'-phosphodiesterase (5'-nucleotidase family)